MADKHPGNTDSYTIELYYIPTHDKISVSMVNCRTGDGEHLEDRVSSYYRAQSITYKAEGPARIARETVRVALTISCVQAISALIRMMEKEGNWPSTQA